MNTKDYVKHVTFSMSSIYLVADYLFADNLRLKKTKSAALFSEDGKSVCRLTVPNGPVLTSGSQSIVMTFGRPNYAERAFLKKFPNSGLRIVEFPKKKSKKSK